MMPRALQLALALLAAGLFVGPTSSARAYELDPGPTACFPPGGNAQWNLSGFPAYRDETVYRPCYPLSYSPPLTISRPPITLTELMNSAESSYDQWLHDGWSRMRLSFDPTICTVHSTPNDGSWWDDGNEISEISWSSSSAYAGPPPSWGALRRDHEACFFAGDAEYLATDIDITDQYSVRGAESTTMWDCLADSRVVEDINLHEIGHSYGLDHNNAWLTTMNESVGFQNRRCNVGEGWAPKPWSDETQGMMEMYGFANWNSVVDVTGSLRHGTFASPSTTYGTANICRSAGNTSTPAGAQLAWTYGNHYGNPSGILYRYLLLPEAYAGTNPVGQAATTSPWSFIASNWTFPGAAYQVSNQTVAFNASALVLQRYRLWVQLLPAGGGSQVDPGDNVFPLSYLVRINPC